MIILNNTKQFWKVPPEGGDLLIWDSRHDGTGHVAVVTAVDGNQVKVNKDQLSSLTRVKKSPPL